MTRSKPQVIDLAEPILESLTPPKNPNLDPPPDKEAYLYWKDGRWFCEITINKPGAFFSPRDWLQLQRTLSVKSAELRRQAAQAYHKALRSTKG